MKTSTNATDVRRRTRAVRQWATILDWPRIRRFTVTHKGMPHTGYTAGRLTHMRLQINELPTLRGTQRSITTHQAVVFSDRFGIRTPWQDVSLVADDSHTRSEARRLKDLLHFKLFSSE